MPAETFTYNPSSQPNAWGLLVGPDRVGSVAYDSFNRYVSRLEYVSFDPYAPDFFKQLAKQIFTDRASIRQIHVAFLQPDWCWLPTAIIGEKEATAWLSHFWAEKPGHHWISDAGVLAEATAWTSVPLHLLEQLQKLSPMVTYRHAALFAAPAHQAQPIQMEILRMGQWCWFTVWREKQFLYTQPHVITGVDDLLCVLSLLADAYNIQPDRTALHLLGEWSTEAPELSALRKRFRHIHGMEVGWKNLPGDQPPHWFTPMANLLSCA